MSRYDHLKKCELGSWQGLYEMRREIPVLMAIEGVLLAQRMSETGSRFMVNSQSCLQAILLADFLFQKIAFSAKDAGKVRKIKNALKPQRTISEPHKWFQRKKSSINEMMKLLENPLKKEGDQEIKIGPFTVKNPIHLEDEKVKVLEQAIEKALKLCTNSLAPNFTNALYGDVVLVENIGKSKVVAFYNAHTDSITMKYFDTRDTEDFIKTFIHEVGHRYYQRTLSLDKKYLWRDYDRNCHRGGNNLHLSSLIGVDDLGIYGTKKKITKGRYKGQYGYGWTMDPNMGEVPLRIRSLEGRDVVLETLEGERWGGNFGYWEAKPIKVVLNAISGLFPTAYATVNEEEHFCEAISYKGVGKLHPKSLEAFNSIFLKGEAYTPNSEDFKGKFTPEVSNPTKETQVEETLPTKKEMNTKAEALANRLGLKFEDGRKYGVFIYTNEAVGSTHAYMFLDYATGNFFAPKSKAIPNTAMNLANISDTDLDQDLGFERMSNLKPKWRTMFTISEPVKEAEIEEIVDQTPEPEIAITPEVNEEGIIDASMKLARALGMGYKVLKKFVRIDYLNQEQGTTHSYLLIDKDSGIVYPPKHRQLIKDTHPFGSVLEPNILSKVNTDKMDSFLPAWRTKYVHPKRK